MLAHRTQDEPSDASRTAERTAPLPLLNPFLKIAGRPGPKMRSQTGMLTI